MVIVRESRYTDTKQKLAARCGISYRRLLSNWDRPSRPKDHSQGSTKYDVQAYREWIGSWKSAHNFGSRNSDDNVWPRMNERERAYAERAKIAAERERFRLEIEMAEYIPRLDANRQVETGNTIVRRELRKAFEFELPPRVEMMKAAEVRRIMVQKYNEIVGHLPKLFMGSNGSNSN